MTTDLDPRFRRADGLSAPDLWPDIQHRAEGAARGPGFDRRRWLTIAVAAAIAAGAFGGLWLAFNGSGHTAAGLHANGPIVFAKNVGIGPDGLAITQLWARDPVTGRTAQVRATMGSPVDPLTTSIVDPAWSPDGSKVAFRRVDQGQGFRGQPTITVVRTDGTFDRTVLACTFACQVFDLTWSPDGSHLAWIEVSAHGGRSAIRVEKVDGGPVITICQNGVCGTDLAQLTWAPDGARLAFSNQSVVLAEGPQIQQSSIWVVAADGSSQQRLTPGNMCHLAWFCTADSSPAWSPDGRSIAFLRWDLGSMIQSETLMRIDANGSRERALVGCRQGSCLGAPVWSPDGSSLASIILGAKWDPKVGSIALIDPASGAVTHRLHPAENGGCAGPFSPVWSPDGKQLLVAAHPWHATNLCVVSVNGVRPILVAHDVVSAPSQAGTWVPPGAIDPATGPAPSLAPRVGSLVARLPLPPGKVVFGVRRMPGGHPRGGIYQVQSDGSGFGRYFSPCVPAFSPGATGSACGRGSTGIEIVLPYERVLHVQPGRGYYFGSPVWSSVGDRIAFTARAFSGRASIWVTNGALRDPVRVGQLAQDETDPTWSPDGTQIAARRPNHGRTDGQSEIDVIAAATGDKTPVLQVTGVVSDLAWSPDGQWIVFRWDTATASGIWLVHPDGTGLRYVPTPTSASGQMAWSPDSQYLVFGADDANLHRGLYAARISDGATALIARAQPGVDGVTWIPGSS